VVKVPCQIVLKKIKNKTISSNLINGDIYQLPFKDDEFDLCWNLGTIEHLKLPCLALLEMKRIAKRHVICCVPAPSIIWRFATFTRRIVETDCSLWTENTIYYEEAELKVLFEEAGFSNVCVEQQRFLWIPLVNIVFGVKN